MKICVRVHTVRTVLGTPQEYGQDVFEGDDLTTEFDLSSPCQPNGLLVFVNGVLAKSGDGNTYTLNESRDKITFIAAPAGGDLNDEIVAFYVKA